MKQIIHLCIALALLAASLSSCGDSKGNNGEVTTEIVDPKNPPVMQFKDTTYDFGTISQGQIVKYVFKFKNVGKSSLVIQDVRPTCGCTVPKNWPKNPIAEGESAQIEVAFDSAGKQGKVTKTIRVIANTKPTVTVLRLVGTITAPGDN